MDSDGARLRPRPFRLRRGINALDRNPQKTAAFRGDSREVAIDAAENRPLVSGIDQGGGIGLLASGQ
ncbi:hypothetical protein [Roseococcus sp. YIM B11640]|uniref:hypothetical protein n=1 Tax=Roseococcus sp. YIM B11640 TaxID=3133973 RepID=UPI003C7ACE7F